MTPHRLDAAFHVLWQGAALARPHGLKIVEGLCSQAAGPVWPVSGRPAVGRIPTPRHEACNERQIDGPGQFERVFEDAEGLMVLFCEGLVKIDGFPHALFRPGSSRSCRCAHESNAAGRLS